MIQTWQNLFNSRKFWLVVLDAVGGIIPLVIVGWLAPTVVDKVLLAWGLMQPVFIIIINGIAVEDAADKSAYYQAAIQWYTSQVLDPCCDALLKEDDDEWDFMDDEDSEKPEGVPA